MALAPNNAATEMRADKTGFLHLSSAPELAYGSFRDAKVPPTAPWIRKRTHKFCRTHVQDALSNSWRSDDVKRADIARPGL